MTCRRQAAAREDSWEVKPTPALTRNASFRFCTVPLFLWYFRRWGVDWAQRGLPSLGTMSQSSCMLWRMLAQGPVTPQCLHTPKLQGISPGLRGCLRSQLSTCLHCSPSSEQGFCFCSRQRILGLSNSPWWASFYLDTLEAPKGVQGSVLYSPCPVAANAMPQAGVGAKFTEGRDDSWQGNMPLQGRRRSHTFSQAFACCAKPSSPPVQQWACARREHSPCLVLTTASPAC